MEIQTKHRVELLNAKCEVVNKLYTACKKSEYGDMDTECCLEGMYAKTKLIKRLEDYCFQVLPIVTTEVLSVFYSPIERNNYASGTILNLYANGYLIGTRTVVGSEYKPTFWTNFLASLSIPTVIDASGENVLFTSTFSCDTKLLKIHTINVDKTVVIDTPFNSVLGACITPFCSNCIEDTDLPKMYEVLKKLGK